MNLTIRILGAEVLAITTEATPDAPACCSAVGERLENERGDCTTYPVGFATPTSLPIRETERDYK